MKITDEVINEIWNLMKSRVILTAAELDIFSQLYEAPREIEYLKKTLEVDKRGLSRLLDCLVSLNYLYKEKGSYGLTDKGLILSSQDEQSILPMVLHINDLWNSWSHLTETVKEGKNPKLRPVTERDEENFKDFIGAMHVVGRDLAWEIASYYDLSPYKRLLDIGGASGTYVAAFLHKNPNLRAILFDLPKVIPMAKERLTKENILERIELVAGDFYQDDLPTGCDVALLSAIIHQNSTEENENLFKKIYQVLEPGGTVLIRDHIMEEDRTSPANGSLFALNMLVNTQGGDTYTFEEVEQGLEKAGFRDVQLIRKGENMDCLVEGRK